MTKANSSDLLKSVHDTAGELANHGFITKRRMSQYDALCLEPVPTYTSARIKKLRKNLKISQAVWRVYSIPACPPFGSGRRGPRNRVVHLRNCCLCSKKADWNL